jgi:hypothetical protein
VPPPAPAPKRRAGHKATSVTKAHVSLTINKDSLPRICRATSMHGGLSAVTNELLTKYAIKDEKAKAKAKAKLFTHLSLPSPTRKRIPKTNKSASKKTGKLTIRTHQQGDNQHETHALFSTANSFGNFHIRPGSFWVCA